MILRLIQKAPFPLWLISSLLWALLAGYCVSLVIQQLRDDGHNTRMMRLAIEQNTSAIIIVDKNHRIVYWNHAAEGLLGYTAHEAIGLPPDMIVPDDFRAEHHERFAERVKTKAGRYQHTLECTAISKYGKRIPIRLSLRSFADHKSFFAVIDPVEG